MEVASCIDTVRNSFYSFTCDGTTQNPVPYKDVYKLRKCCDKNFSFDIRLRRCIENNQLILEQDFADILTDNVAVFEAGLPECEDDEVLVEYYSSVHELNISQNSLVITDASNVNDILLLDSFCIDSTINSFTDIVTSNITKNELLRGSSKWISKVCRNKSVCNQMPCIRKCCKDGQRMVFDGITLCESHDQHLDLQFHSFDTKNTLEKPSLIEPSGDENVQVNDVVNS